MSDDKKIDMGAYDFNSRVQNALGIMHKDSNKSLESLNEILSDFFKFTPEEIKENGLSSVMINALNAKGSILNAYDDIENAEKCFDLVLCDYDSKDFTSLINKALILRKKGFLEEALDYYEKISESYPNKRELVLAMESEVYDDLKVKFSDADLSDFDDEAADLIEQGMSYKDKNMVLKALGSYEKAIKTDVKSKYLVMSLMDEVKREFFKIFLYEDINPEDELKEKKGGILHYLFIQNNLFYAYMLNEEILEENNNDLFALNAKGMIFFFLDDCNLAVEYFNRSIESDDSYLYPFFNRAVALARLKRFDEASESYGKIMALPELVFNPAEEEISIFNRAIIANGMYSLGF